MNEAEIAALTVGITEITKNLGLPTRFCPIFAIFLAVGISIADEFHRGGSDFFNAVFRGALIGVTTTGSYSAIEKFSGKVAKNANAAQETH